MSENKSNILTFPGSKPDVDTIVIKEVLCMNDTGRLPLRTLIANTENIVSVKLTNADISNMHFETYLNLASIARIVLERHVTSNQLEYASIDQHTPDGKLTQLLFSFWVTGSRETEIELTFNMVGEIDNDMSIQNSVPLGSSLVLHTSDAALPLRHTVNHIMSGLRELERQGFTFIFNDTAIYGIGPGNPPNIPVVTFKTGQSHLIHRS